MTQDACETGAELTVQCKAHFRSGNRGRKRLEPGAAPEAPVVERGRVPRLTRLMALAIRFDRLVREGQVADYADLARLGHVARARMTQIMNLLTLAPDIQEAILFLPRTVAGQDPISERQIRRIVAEPYWSQQRRIWCTLSHTFDKPLTPGDLSAMTGPDEVGLNELASAELHLAAAAPPAAAGRPRRPISQERRPSVLYPS